MKKTNRKYLYLITMTNCKTPRIKIGQSNNVENRMKAYKTHNPNIKLLSSWKQTKTNCETNWHILLEYLGFKSINNTEWYKCPKSINKRQLNKIGIEYLEKITQD